MSKAYGVLADAGGGEVLPAPTNLSYDAISGTTIQVACDPVSGATGYQWYVDGAPSTLSSAETAQISGLTASTTYSITVKALSGATSGAISAALSVTTPSASAPEWSGALTGQVARVGSAFLLELSSFVTDPDSPVTSYSVVSGSIGSLTLNSTTGRVSGTPSGAVAANDVTFRASDGFDDSDVTISFEIRVPDTTAPTVPVLSTPTLSGSNILLDWTESTDADSGFLDYRIYRSSTEFGTYTLRVASVSATSYTDSGTEGQTYWYKLTARDVALNENSLGSVTARSISIPVSSPNPPTLVSVGSATASSLVVAYTPPASGPAPDSFNIYRSTTQNGTYSLVGNDAASPFTNTGLTASTTYWYKLKSVRLGVESTAFSNAVSGATSGTTAVRWNPGHYVRDSTVLAADNTAPNTATLNDVLTIPGIKGLMIPIAWSVLESTKGVYTWTRLDNLITQAANANKKVLIEIFTRWFGSAGSGVGAALPTWLDSEGLIMRVNSGSCVALHRTAAFNYARNLFQAVAARYAENSAVEMILTSETANPFDTINPSYPKPADFNQDTYMNNLAELAIAGAAVAPKINFVCMYNWGPESTAEAFGARLAAGRVGIGGPDIIPQVVDLDGDTNTSIQRWVRLAKGLRWNGSSWVSGGTVYGGYVPILGQIQGPEMGGKEGCWSMQQFYTEGLAAKVTHFAWTAKKFEWTAIDPATGRERYDGHELLWDTLARDPADVVTPTQKQWLTDNGATSLPYTGYPTRY